MKKMFKGLVLGLFFISSNAFALDIITFPTQLIRGCYFNSFQYTHALCFSLNVTYYNPLGIFLLPFTLLDEETGEMKLDTESLLAQGYDQSEIDELMMDHQKVDQLSSERGVKNFRDAKKLLTEIKDELSPITREIYGV